MRPHLAIALAAALAAGPVTAQTEAPAEAEPPAAAEAVEGPMTLDRMGEIVRALDEQALDAGRGFRLTIGDVPITIVTDPGADRMRAFAPIRSADGLTREELERLMQANFDTALDARYAVAQGRVWAVFIHPLAPLERDQLIEGLGQVANLALTYGSSYSSGLLSFGGGDSRELERRRLIDELLKRGEDI